MRKLDETVIEILGNGLADEEPVTNTGMRMLLFQQHFYPNPNPEHIRASIHRLRLAGHSIVSDNTGYYLTQDESKVADCVESLRKRAESILEAADALENSINK